MADFSLDLNEDQQQIQKWVHDFAENVVRPAAHEWDEREEFPWPIVEEAARNGLYGFDFMANAMGDPTGLTLPVALEELFWGTPASGWPSSARPSRPPASSASERPSSPWSGCRSATARRTT